MPLGFLFITVALPLLEIVLLIKLGQSIGFWSTMLVLVASAFAGLAIVQHQGLRAFNAMAAAMAKGEPPVSAMTDGVMLMIAGTLFIVPGLVTDMMGLALLVPPVRRWVAGAWLRRMRPAADAHADMDGGGRRPGTRHPARGDMRDGMRGDGPRAAAPDGPVIEGEFERLDEQTVDPNRPRKR